MNASFCCFPKSLRRLGYILALGAATSCGVYVPHVPPTPILAPGKVEVQAAVLPLFGISKEAGGFQLTRPVIQGSVAYSPLNHLFVMATGGGNAFRRYIGLQSYGVRERQGDLGIGAYTWLTPTHNMYLSGMAGFGSGTSSRLYSENEWGILSPIVSGGARTNFLFSTYYRQFAQGQLSFVEGPITYTGFTRVARVKYDFLSEVILASNGYAYTNGSYYGLSSPPTTYYLDFGYSIRFSQGDWMWALEGVFSGPLNRHSLYYEKAELAYNASLLAVGVTWQPGRNRPASPAVK